MERFLGGEQMRAIRRTVAEAKGHLARVSKLQREGLSLTEKAKLQKVAEDGLEGKFSLMEPIVGAKANKEQLKTIYSITMRVEEFRKSLQAFDMEDEFTVASSYEFDTDEDEFHPGDESRAINLFTSIKDVDLETVKQASSFQTSYGQDWMLQNLLWSGTKLLNSCDDKLRRKIKEKTIGWSVNHSTGPVYFKIMMQNILASTPASMRGLTTLLQDTSLRDFDGENVTEFASFSRGAIEQLRNNDALPGDVLTITATALKMCETEEFMSYISTMYNNHILGVRNCNVDDMLLAAETEYVNLTSAKKWKAKATISEDSVFFAGKCYGCGKDNHMLKNCPDKNKNGGGRGCGNQRGGRGRGRGGGGGRGHGRDRGRGGRGNSGRGFIEKDKSPPKSGESHTRTRNNRVEKWCGRCGYWTWADKAHVSDDCPYKTHTGASTNVSQETSTNAANATDSTKGSNAGSTTGFGGLVFHASDF